MEKHLAYGAVLCLLSLAVYPLSSLHGAARPLSVSAPDGSGNVTVTIGGEGTGDQALIAAWANGDKGNDPLDWTEYADAGTVAASDTSKSFQIPAAWRSKSGAVRFFLMSGPKPYGKRYDYITRPIVSDGGLYINTGIVPDPSVDISVKFQSPQFSGGTMVPFGIHKIINMFSASSENDNYHFYFFGAENPRHPALGFQLGADDTDVFGNKLPKDSDPHTFRMSRDGIWIDGYRRVGAFNSEHFTNTTDLAISLFGRNGNWKQKSTVCSIYSAVIYTNGVLAADLVPVAAPSGYVQMWDRVTREYRGESGTQTDGKNFDAGNDIGPYPPDCGTVESVSDAIGFGPAIAIAGQDAVTRSVDVTLSSEHDTGLLFAVADSADEGTAYSSWTTNMFVAKVGAGTNSVTVPLPREWWRNKYNVRFAWKSMAGKPYDYEIENIDSSTTTVARIRTGVVPTTNTTMSVVAKAGYNTAFFGLDGSFSMLTSGMNGSAATGYSVRIFYIFFQSSSGSGTCNGGYDFQNPQEFLSSYHEYRLGPAGVYIDGTLVANLTGRYAPDAGATAGIVLPFRASTKSSDQYANKTGDVSIRSARIWEGDEIMFDYVPCVKNGVVGFYDKVRGTFNRSVTIDEKPFIAGDIVVDDGDFVSWSEAKKLTPIGFIISFR